MSHARCDKLKFLMCLIADHRSWIFGTFHPRG
jgi:hypothetical protein